MVAEDSGSQEMQWVIGISSKAAKTFTSSVLGVVGVY